MLDVSQYTASRKIRDFEIMEFWRPENLERLRRESLIYGDEGSHDEESSREDESE
jgi:hypothetical protein